MQQSEKAIEVLHQIQRVANAANGMTLNIQQVKFQEQQNEMAVQSTQDTVERAISSVANLQRSVQNASIGLDEIALTTLEKLADAVNSIEDISKQIVQQSMNMTRAVNRSQIEENDRSSIADLSDCNFFFDAAAI